jgi:hypothetical protein
MPSIFQLPKLGFIDLGMFFVAVDPSAWYLIWGGARTLAGTVIRELPILIPYST